MVSGESTKVSSPVSSRTPPTFSDHQFPAVDYILFIKMPVTVDLNPNECNSSKYVTQEELREIIAQAKRGEEGITITPWFGLIAETFLFKWWDHLDQIDSHKDHETIHRFL